MATIIHKDPGNRSYIQSTEVPAYRLQANPDGSVQAVSSSSFTWVIHEDQGRISDYDATLPGSTGYLLGLTNGSVRVGEDRPQDPAEVGWTCEGGLTKVDAGDVSCITAIYHPAAETKETTYSNGEAMYLFSDVDSSGHFTKLWCENGFLSSWTAYTWVSSGGRRTDVRCISWPELPWPAWPESAEAVPCSTSPVFELSFEGFADYEMTCLLGGDDLWFGLTNFTVWMSQVGGAPYRVQYTCCPGPGRPNLFTKTTPAINQWHDINKDPTMGDSGCPEGYALGGIGWKANTVDEPTSFQQSFTCFSFGGVSLRDEGWPPSFFGFPPYELNLASCESYSITSRWTCPQLPSGGGDQPPFEADAFPLGTCQAEIFVATPVPLKFSPENEGRCLNLIQEEPEAAFVDSDVQWRCETSIQCFGYNITGSSTSGAGSLFLEPVKAFGSSGNCHVKEISTWSPDAESSTLSLEVQDLDSTNTDPSLRSAYNWTSAIRVVSSAGGAQLFTCLPNKIAPEAPPAAPLSVLCASNVAVKLSDLLPAQGIYAGSSAEALNTTILPSCVALVPPKGASAAAASMTGTTLMALLRSQKFFSTPYGSPSAPPFNDTTSLGTPWTLGFASLTAGGRIMWGLSCPDGAIVASNPRTFPHCLQVGAGAETVHEVLSGSAMCPPGSAVSGWYNLPGLPVRSSGSGGPSSWTSARLFCRRTDLLSNCQQPMDPHCKDGEVVSGIIYDDAVKMRCCQLQQPLGLRFRSNIRQSKLYKSFEGYYCPTAVDGTGAPFYARTSIGPLGNPGVAQDANATLSWNKWLATWELRVDGGVVGSAPSEVVLPTQLSVDALGTFSAVPIRPLTSFGKKSKPTSPFPKQPPTYPKLAEFHAVQPDYAAYCDPVFLQNPALYSGWVEEGNPCYHTFNAEKPVPGLPKGITEEDFWASSSREQHRNYLFSGAASQQQKMENWINKEIAKTQAIFDDVALAAAIASAIPWGSFAESAEKAKTIAGNEAKAVQKKVVENEVVQSLVSRAKAVAGRVKSLASRSIQTAANVYKKAEAGYDKAKETYDRAQSTYDSISGLPGQAQDQVQQGFDKVSNQERQAANTIGGVESSINSISPIKIPSSLEVKTASEKLQEETMPQPKPPGDSSYENAESQSKAEFADWMPLQYGLSKVMCDLFCIHDSVNAGTSAVLRSLEKSQRVLTDNLQALLDYQTNYILWAVGTVLDPTELAGRIRDVAGRNGGGSLRRWRTTPWWAPTTQELLEELQVELPSQKSVSLSREILGWHQDSSAQLLSRAAAFTRNASRETWPYRARALRGMLRHFRAHFAKRLAQEPEAAGQRQISEKLQLLRDQSAQRRALGERARSLRLWLPDSGPVTLDASSQVLWNSLLEGFLATHEKHNTFTMLRLQVLDDTDAALHVAANFSVCGGADTSLLRESWQQVARAEERANVALQEAWSATLTAAERLRIAFKEEGILHHLIRGAVLDDESVERLEGCEDQFHQIGQSLFSHAVQVVNRVVQPLLMQLITFEALQGYQEEELKSRGLRYLPSPPHLGLRALKTELVAAVDPSTPAGRALATRAMNVLGKRICPSPCVETSEAMLVARRNGTDWIAREPGRVLFGQARAVACGPFYLDAGAPRGDWHRELDMTHVAPLVAEECTSLVLMEALGV
ncbi:NEK5 [Symbiodinium natans]|uniref:NEK5 protein n=1 Tax=Symbiodinium natans TaxID=878477 RepID=A0A812PVQ4_9DINO|nr:NEK5 [Symbiodinium natans]